MSGKNIRNTGTRPKTNQNQHSRERSSGSVTAQADAANLADIFSLLRDQERLKNSINYLQTQLQQTEKQNLRIRPFQPQTRSDEERSTEVSLDPEILGGFDPGTLQNDERDIENLRRRLHDLEGMKRDLESVRVQNRPPPTGSDPGRENTSSRLNRTTHGSGSTNLESDPDTVERNLALLTAQYEKNQEDEFSSYPPAMSILNHWRDDSSLREETQRVANQTRTQVGAPANSFSERRLMNPVHPLMDAVPSNIAASTADPRLAEDSNSNHSAIERDLRERKEQLEQLIKKTGFSANINDSGKNECKNDTASESRFSNKKLNVRSKHHTVLPPSPPRRTNYREPRNYRSSLADREELGELQEQARNLLSELDRLVHRSSPDGVHSQESGIRPPSDGETSHILPLPLEAQVHQLALSMNQIYQVMWNLQREVSFLSRRVAAMERGGRRPASRNSEISPTSTDPWTHGSGNVSWNGSAHAGPGLHWGGGEVPSWTRTCVQAADQFSPYPSRELWNSLQNSPGFTNSAPFHEPRNLNPVSAIPSNATTEADGGALNNQVSPGMRANNYYDNFRSFSRQNRFSTPPSLQNGRGSARQNSESAPANNAAASFNRTRKKYKINREQNKDQNNARKRTQANQAQDNQETSASSTRNEAVNLYTSPTHSNQERSQHSSIDNIAKNIYSQIESIISRNDKAPEFLAVLLDDLTLLGSQQNINISPVRTENRAATRRDERAANLNLDIADTSSITSDEGMNRPQLRAVRSKVGTKRPPSQSPLPLLTPLQVADHDSSGGSHAAGFPADGVFPYGQATGSAGQSINLSSATNQHSHQASPSHANSSSDSRRNSQPNQMKASSSAQPSAPAVSSPCIVSSTVFSLPSRVVTSSSSAFSSFTPTTNAWTAANSSSQHSFAVPKNQQKNLMSRERDSRRGPGCQERGLPRNMQGMDAISDPDGFINVQLHLPQEQREEPNQAQIEEAEVSDSTTPAQRSISDLTEAELAEADQVRSPEDQVDQHQGRQHISIPNRDPDSPLDIVLNQVPLMVGLDRVPIRLPSSHEVEARRQLEDEAVASLVEEVLASSPELANPSSSDLPPEM